MDPADIYSFPQSIVTEIVRYFTPEEREIIFAIDDNNQCNVRIIREIKELNPDAQKEFDNYLKTASKGETVFDRLYSHLTDSEVLYLKQKKIEFQALFIPCLVRQPDSYDFIQLLIYLSENGPTSDIKVLLSSGVLSEKDINYAIDLIFFNPTRASCSKTEEEYFESSLFIFKKTTNPAVLRQSFIEIVKVHKLKVWKFKSIMQADTEGTYTNLALKYGQIGQTEPPKLPELKKEPEKKSSLTAEKACRFKKQKQLTLRC